MTAKCISVQSLVKSPSTVFCHLLRKCVLKSLTYNSVSSVFSGPLLAINRVISTAYIIILYYYTLKNELIFFVELTADFLSLSLQLISGTWVWYPVRKRTPIKTSDNIP
jgi:hypothetical protein